MGDGTSDSAPGGPPAVSIVIPVFDAAEYLREALASVWAQEFVDYEVIVVDDASTDGSGDVAAEFDGVQVLRHRTNQGAAAARNTGIDVARGGLVAFLDADDRWSPDKLRRQTEHLAGHPEIGYAVTLVQNFLEPGTAFPPWLPPHALEQPALGLMPSALIVRADVFSRVGGFDRRYELGEDNVWFARCEEVGITRGTIQRVLVERRVHSRNLSYRVPGGEPELPRFLKSFLDRKRSLGIE